MRGGRAVSEGVTAQYMANTHLRPRVPLRDHRPRQPIPETDLLVGRPAPAREHAPVMRTPRNRLDRRRVLREAVQRHFVRLVPHKQLVVVAARCELVRLRVPPQATHLLPVALELPDVVLRDPHVAVEDGAVTRARRQDVLVPREAADPTRVAGHGADLFAFFRVPYLHLALVRANGDGVALRGL